MEKSHAERYEEKVGPSKNELFRSQVDKLVAKLELKPERVMDLSEGQGEEFENGVLPWISAIDFREGEENVNSIPKDVNQKLSNEEALGILALTEAKLTVVRDLMEDVYPLLSERANEYLTELETEKNKMTGGSVESTSIKEISRSISGRKSKLTGLFGTLVVASMILAACTTVNAATPRSSETTPTNGVPTMTETYIPTQTRTPEPTATLTKTTIPTETATPTEVKPDMAVAVESFKLNQDRTYTISADGYLVDGFNQAKMAKWEKSHWVETSLEEKYGHLVPENKEFSITSFGNMFFFERGNTGQMSDRAWEQMEFLTWSTGNVKSVESFNEDLQKNVVGVYGEVLFRDKGGKLNMLNVRFDVIDPATKFRLPVCTIADKDGSMYPDHCGAMNGLLMSSLKEEMDYYSKPGQQLMVIFNIKLPGKPLKYIDGGDGYVDTRYVATFYDWMRDTSTYQTLAEMIKNYKSPENLPKDFVLSAQYVAIYMNQDELIKIYK